jgi:hypothetical protein
MVIEIRMRVGNLSINGRFYGRYNFCTSCLICYIFGPKYAQSELGSSFWFPARIDAVAVKHFLGVCSITGSNPEGKIRARRHVFDQDFLSGL